MKKTKNRQPAFFLDRDGTIIVDVGYPKDPNKVKLLPDAAATLAALQRHGYKLIMISNQSGIGRGILTYDEVNLVNQRIISMLAKEKVVVDGIYFCPHTPEDRCICRKPSPEMLFRAAKELNIDFRRSFMVGDKESDIEAGKRAGCKTIFLGNNSVSGNLVPMPDFIASNWSEALLYILDK